MKAVIQRVQEASVKVDGELVSSIGKGYMLLLGVMKGDTEKEAELLARKTASLRVFEDENGKMNLSIMILVVKFFLFHSLLFVLIAKKVTDHHL